MLLINALISGGALVAGTKLYQENKSLSRGTREQKEMPWTVYAQRVSLIKHKKKACPDEGRSWLATNISSSLRLSPPFDLRNRLLKDQDSAYDKMKATIQTFKQDKLAVFSIRSQQMQEIVGSEVSEAEKAVNQKLVITSANLGFAGITLFYPSLLWVTLPVLIYTTIPFYQLAYQSLVEEKRISSYVLDTILQTGILFKGYFYTEIVGCWVATLGRKLLIQSENNTKKNLANLFGTQPRSVWVRTSDGVEIEIPFETLQLGDIVMVSAGQTISVDGVITMGLASIDQHKLTGESQPAEKGVGDEVLASTIVLAGRISIRTEKTGEQTVAMQIGKVLDQTASFKNSLQSRGEAIADRLTVPTLGLSMLFLPFFGASGAMAVLTNTFGYKMRVFAPASMLSFLNIASQQGILIKDGRSLELLNQVDTIVFDKTGTLTLEQPTIGQIHAYNGVNKEDILRYAAAAEDGQTHPIAKAILTAAKEAELAWPTIVDAKYEMGYGIQVDLPDSVIRVGSNRFMVMNDIEIPSEVNDVQEHCYAQGHSLVMVAFDSQIVGVIELHATIRPEAKDVINGLCQRGMSMYIISGDHEAPTKTLAQTLGIENYFANTLPENKANLVVKLQEEGKSVCFVGDGINDSIALKAAKVSVSLRGATMIATDTAQVVLMDGSLKKVEEMFDIAQAFEVNMKNNLLISTVPSTICLSGIIFFHWGIVAGMTITTITTLVGIANSIMPLLNQQQNGTSSHS